MVSALLAAGGHACADAGSGLQPRLLSMVVSVPQPLRIAGQSLDRTTLYQFYAGRDYALAWDDPRIGLGDRAAIVLSALLSADREGLNPADYHVREIVALAAADGDGPRRDRDLLISDGLLHYAQDVSVGRLTPADTDERVTRSRDFDPQDCLAFAAALAPDRLETFLAGLRPANREYAALRDMLARLQRLAAAGGWTALPDGRTIHPGEHDPVIPALRQRLQADGRVAESRAGTARAGLDYYDATLSAAVAEFQREHGLRPDGTIGKDTRAALDQPVEARIRQVTVNLERARWSGPPPEGRRVEVNLAAYSLDVIEDGQVLLSMPVVVGTKQNPTPILASHITAVVLNPNWTLPPAVIKEILPRIHGDSGYLASRGIARLEEDGKVRLVQPPGPTNPLGHYKFVIPNNQDIYLHDSPDAAKFRFASRAYSHGCVRVGNPSALANLLLDDQTARFPDGLDALIQDGNTKHISLLKPVPVALVYRTAWLDDDGRLVLGPDGYGRDDVLWAALHKPRHSFGKQRLAERSRQASTL
jgi:murein L,D-transpeptidase YcbB/YkuD